jgi:glucose/arabinose dehydrogenase
MAGCFSIGTAPLTAIKLRISALVFFVGEWTQLDASNPGGCYSMKTRLNVRVLDRGPISAVALFVLVTLACAQSTPKSTPQSSTGVLGHHEIKLSSLPAPEVLTGPRNQSKVIPRPEGAELTLPPGFQISVFAEGELQQPRGMLQAPNGDVFVTESQPNRITILRDSNNDGKVDERFAFASGLSRPFGIALWRDYLYVGNLNGIVRFKYKPGQTQAEGEPEKIAELPGGPGHWTRNVIFNQAGTKMYVAVGSASNVNSGEPPIRAAISEYNPDGTGQRIYASGTRNPVGLAWNPTTKQLWAAVEERDLIGDELVPEYVTSIKDGGFYGWPYSYLGQNEDPRRKGERPDLVAKAIVPDVLIQAHSAVLGMVFYEGKMFPSEFQGDAFVALHGSWNRTLRTGYKIIRIKFKNGKPIGGYDDFVTGWMLGEDKAEVWGRPVGVLVLRDGSMLISDDGGHKIWRVTYSMRK